MAVTAPPRRLVAVHVATVVGVALMLGGAVLALIPWIRIPLDVIAMLGAFNAYGVVVAACGAALAVVANVAMRRRRLGRGRWLPPTIGALILAGLMIMQAPHWIPDRRPAAPGPRFVLASMNLHLGEADAASVVAATADADVVAFTEITTSEVVRLAEASFEQRFRYRLENVTLPHRGAEGTMIFSRWPLEPAESLWDDSTHQNWASAVTVPELGRVGVVAVHAQRPFLTGTNWAREHDTIIAALPTAPLTVVAGDFNASPDQVAATGYTSAVDITGSGWITTFPVDSRVPRLLRIDHVLLGSELTTTSVQTLPVAGSDHLGLQTVIARRAG